MIPIAICQIDIASGLIESNLEKIVERIQSATIAGAELIVFPELALTGYLFDDEEEVETVALEDSDDTLQTLHLVCSQRRVTAVVGYIEKTGLGLYNTAAIFGIEGAFPKYRKIHLPVIGADRFLNRGDLGFNSFRLPKAAVGLNICYDQRFPESARTVALKGAQVIIVPTCESAADHEVNEFLIRTRAYENRVFYVWANRVGEEKGRSYNGVSRIVDPFGEVIALGNTDEEDMIFAEIDPFLADEKQTVVDPGNYEFDIFQDRVPEHYRVIVEDD